MTGAADDVYDAARRLYLWGELAHPADVRDVRAWALKRWAAGFPVENQKLGFWVLSQAAQDGHE